MRNLVEYMIVYRDGNCWVVVETGMPEFNVRIGYGDTLAEAYQARQSTPMQSVGRDSGLKAALEWAEGAGWIDEASELEVVDDAVLSESDLEA